MMGALLSAVALVGCGGGQDDGRLAAIQAALDARQPFINVPNGKVCHLDVYWPAGNSPDKFKGLSYVSVKAAGVQHDMMMGTQPCTIVTWAPSAHFTVNAANEENGSLPIGRFIVDKVGDEQDGPLGTKVTPFKVHFEWSAIGKDMLARHLAQEPTPPTDPMAELHKDADGKWVAQL
jgi:hypothetical protein